MSTSGHDPGDAGADHAGARASSGEHAVTTHRHDSEELPLVDPAVLEDLEAQLAGPDIASRFARDYAAMWAQRQRCLDAAVERQDRAAALDAVISLKVSAAMVGGMRLAGLAEALETLIRDGSGLEGGRAMLALVADHGSATVKELQDSYLREGR
jgi:HPt (histidine-containing phosphotransfer) domain-containing protein